MNDLKIIGSLISLFFFLNCSGVRFKSQNKIATSFDSLKNHNEFVSINVSRPFYLWGLIPSEHVVEVDSEFIKKGFDSVSELEILEIDKKTEFVWSALTLGMYIPKKYKLTGKITNK